MQNAKLIMMYSSPIYSCHLRTLIITKQSLKKVEIVQHVLRIAIQG